MKVRNILAIVLLISCILLVIGSVSASDDVSVSCDATNFTELNDSIQKNSKIELENNIILSDDEKTQFKSGIFITKNITIDGKNHVINANNAARIFNIVNGSATLTLNNITLMNGNAAYGAAIFADSSKNININASNVIFANNTVSQTGGVIYTEGNLYMNTFGNVFFNGNNATKGGAIFVGGIVNIKALGNVFLNNNNASNTAGAIYAIYDVIIDAVGIM